jgi:hypothetical protein
LVARFEGKKHSEDLDVDGIIILEMDLREIRWSGLYLSDLGQIGSRLL